MQSAVQPPGFGAPALTQTSSQFADGFLTNIGSQLVVAGANQHDSCPITATASSQSGLASVWADIDVKW
jgi:hypothetical protein